MTTVRGLFPGGPLAATLLVALVVAACSGSGLPTIPPGNVPIASASAAASPGAGASPGVSPAPAASSPSSSAASSPAPGRSGALASCPTSEPPPLAAGQTRTVTIRTVKGDIVIKVEGSLGPNAAGNFVALAACGFYDGVIFHRLVPGFVIQGGDGAFGREPLVQTGAVGRGGPGYTFPDDPVTVAYTRGTVAMANSGPDSNGSQFFICLADLGTQLPPNYSVFGHVASGMDIVDAIAAMPNTGGQDNLAVDPVAMDKVTVANP
jgi:cyclophilin family peptidyl-prolyl cis-trans isomerase